MAIAFHLLIFSFLGHPCAIGGEQSREKTVQRFGNVLTQPNLGATSKSEFPKIGSGVLPQTRNFQKSAAGRCKGNTPWHIAFRYTKGGIWKNRQRGAARRPGSPRNGSGPLHFHPRRVRNGSGPLHLHLWRVRNGSRPLHLGPLHPPPPSGGDQPPNWRSIQSIITFGPPPPPSTIIGSDPSSSSDRIES